MRISYIPPRAALWSTLSACVVMLCSCASAPRAARDGEGRPGSGGESTKGSGAAYGDARVWKRPAIAVPTVRPFPIGGRHKPAVTGDGELRALVVFVRFAGDTVRTGTWPDPGRLPEWAETLVDTDADAIGYHPRNLSMYYRINSAGRFTLTGDVHYLTLPHPETWYHTEVPGDDVAVRGRIIRDALEILTDPEGAYNVDLARFDQWTTTSEYQHEPGPDGVLDLILFLTRTMRDEAPVLAKGSLPWRPFMRASADFNIADAPFTSRGVRINAVSGTVHASAGGVMLFADNARKQVAIFEPGVTTSGAPSLIGELVHELSHHLFGAGHLADGGTSLANRRYCSYLTGYAVNSGNAFGNHLAYEKIRLGWMDDGVGLRTIHADEDDVTVTIDDPVTTADTLIRAVRIEMPGTTQAFMLESRGWKGAFESRWAPYNGPQARLRPGLLLTHLITEDRVLAMSRMRMLPADGRFIWRLDSLDPGMFPYNVRDAISRDSADAFNGYDEREKIFAGSSPRWYLAGFWPTPAGSPPARGPYRACTNCLDDVTPANDNVGDRFDLFDTGDVITPWSNPAIALWRDRSRFDPAPLGIHILAFDSVRGSYTIRILRSHLEQLPVARPTGLRPMRADEHTAPAQRTSGTHPKAARGLTLVWSLNREPGMEAGEASKGGGRTAGAYRIERSFDGTHYEPAGIVMHPARTFPDDTPLPRYGERIWYRLVAIGRDGRESLPSEPCAVSSTGAVVTP